MIQMPWKNSFSHSREWRVGRREVAFRSRCRLPIRGFRGPRRMGTSKTPIGWAAFYFTVALTPIVPEIIVQELSGA